jgi:HEAT repeat protein
VDDIVSLISLLGHADPRERVRAARALEDLAMPGRVPAPPVLEALRRGIPVFVAALNDSERLVRLKSVRILGQLGPMEGEATLAVAELLLRPGEDSVMRDEAMTTVGLMGPAALPIFWQMWKAPNKGKRWRTKVLSRARHIGPEALPLLLQGFKKKNPDYWTCVEEAVGLLEHELHHDASPVLIEALGSKKPLLCINAGGLLLVRRPELRRHVVGRLRPFLSHPAPWVRLAAVWALQKAGEGAEEALPDLLALLPLERGEDGSLRAGVIEVLCRLGPKAAAAVGVLAEIVHSDPSDHLGNPFSKLAAEALAEIGPAARDAVPSLIEMLQDDRPTAPTGIPNSIFAALALGSIGPAARPAAGALEQLLGRAIPALRHNVIRALEQVRAADPARGWWSRLFGRKNDPGPGQG